ncbi:MAG: cupin domain-containing protein [Chitinophagaceae bacterium]|nr:cupin domain-containing protein [Chitinophagaceae bacterium]
MPSIKRRKLFRLASALLAGTAISKTGFSRIDTNNRSIDPETVFIPAGAGKKGKIGDSIITFKLDKEQTSGSLGSSESIIPPGKLGAPPHYHKTFDEICIVLEGTLHIMVENAVYEATAGAWHLRPRNKVHTFWNSGKVPAKVIEIYSPAGHEDYMKELASLFENGQRPAPDKLQQLTSKHDIIFQFEKLQEIKTKYGVDL